jgi:hypothetical protein
MNEQELADNLFGQPQVGQKMDGGPTKELEMKAEAGMDKLIDGAFGKGIEGQGAQGMEPQKMEGMQKPGMTM